MFCAILFIGTFSKAQSSDDWKILSIIMGIRLEMTSLDNKAFLSFGPKYPINDKNYLSLRGHFNWWDFPDRKLIVIPELDYIYKVATIESDMALITNLYTGVGISPYAISPKAGINFYNLFSAEFGNNFEFNPYRHFSTKGFRFSIGINLIF